MSYIHENHSQFVHILYKKKNVQVSKASGQSSFQNAKNVFVEPLESLMFHLAYIKFVSINRRFSNSVY